jgi:Tat protein translocase TatC
MPFLDHLEELRWRILKSLVALVVTTLVGWVLVERIDVIGLLMRPIAPLLPGGRLAFTSPTEPFLITLKFAFVVGLLLASPVVVYQAWAFLAPALYEREKRLIVPALSVGVCLFLGGAAVAYQWVMPRALVVLFSFQRKDLAPIITADAYFGFAAQIMIAFGLVTELPLVLIILAALGLVTPEGLKKNRRYAIVLSTGAAALLMPPDAVSMLLMMLPLWGFYELSILGAWVAAKRRARRERAQAASGTGEAGAGAGGAGGGGATALIAVLLLSVATGLGAQGLPPGTVGSGAPNGPPGVPGRADTTRPRTAADSAALRGRALDTATARRLGLPTSPTRTFPASDAVIDSLRKLKGYRLTQYVADTLIVDGGDSQTIHLRGDALAEREGTKVEADSIRYRQSSCRLDALGDPRLFDQSTVMVGQDMRYDTCIKRGTVAHALTDFQQGGVTWYIRGDLAVDSGSTRMYGANSEITSDDHPVPDYHFATGEMKWLNKDVMVARPAVLYVHDVPIMWLPFIFQDIRKGRRSGILVPRFGLNDVVRPSRGYERHIANVGYYVVLNDYTDFLASGDWYAQRTLSIRAQVRYRWLDQFVTGAFSFGRLDELDQSGHSIRVGWQHQQAFSSRTHFNASIDYATSASVIQTNTVNPYLATASLASAVSFNKRFDWGTFDIGGSRSQDLSNDLITQNFPRVNLTPSPVNVTPAITWSPGFSFNNQQNFHQAQAPLLVTGLAGVTDTLAQAATTRQTQLSFETPFRIGTWNWSNSFSATDNISNARQEVDFKDAQDTTKLHRVVYAQTYSTLVDWQTGINLPSLFSGSWKLQPGLGIVNQTSAGPFMIRNQFTGGAWMSQGKRLEFTASLTPTFFGFFPGLGPIARIRHSISPLVSYAFAPASTVSAAFSHAIDPTGQLLNSRSDPQQTITLGLSQNFEAKLKPAAGDTAQKVPKKLRLLGINTSGVSYNFEQAKQPGRTGWQTQTVNNTFASDLVPGFSLSVTHDLWTGQAGLATSRFNPFLTNVAASFSITPATIQGLGRLFGFGAHAPAPGAPGAPPATPEGQAPGAPLPNTGQFSNLAFSGPGGVSAAGPTGRGFNLSLSYTETRVRPNFVPVTSVVDTVPTTTTYVAGLGGSRQASMNLSFSPTAHWSAQWSSVYDFDTRQFGEHVIRLERDLHRWHASFSFLKSPNGNFGFSFYVSLLDQPDIKFNYEQQTFVQ